MEVGISKINCDIIFAKCSCPAGESGYCNHIMASLFEIPDYSLHQLISIHEEKACTSMVGCTISKLICKTTNHGHSYKEKS